MILILYVLFNCLCIGKINSLNILDITNTSQMFLHSDVIIAGEQQKIVEAAVEESKLLNSRLKYTQYCIFNLRNLTQFVQKFQLSRLNYGDTGLFIVPRNITELMHYVRMLRQLYRQKPEDLYFDSRLYTFVLWPQNNLHSISKSFPLNSEAYVVFEDHKPNSGGFELTEVYSIKNVTFVNTLSPVCSLSTKQCYLFSPLSSRRYDLGGVEIKATSVDHPLDQNGTRYSRVNETLTFAGGQSVQILWDLRDLLNFTIKAMEGDGYISLKKNGKIGGIGAQLLNGEADVAIPMLYFLNYRLKHLTALMPLGNDEIQVFFRPLKTSTIRNIFTSPYSTYTWTSYFATIGLLVISSYLFSWFGSKMHGDRKWWSEECALWVVCVMCQKDWYFNPPNVSSKLIMLIGIFLSLICFTAYSGALISGLTVEKPAIRSVQDLHDYGYKFIFNPEVYFNFFDVAPSESLSTPNWLTRALSRNNGDVNNEKTSNYLNDTDSLEKVLIEKVGFLTTFQVYGPLYESLNYTASDMCNLVSHIAFSKRVLQSGYFVQKGSPLKEVFNSRLLLLSEKGLLHRYQQIMFGTYKNAVRCSKVFGTKVNLGIEDLVTAYFVLLIGISIATFFLVIEFIQSYHYKRRLRKKYCFSPYYVY